MDTASQGYLRKNHKNVDFQAAVSSSIKQTRQHCASYSYTHDGSNKYGVLHKFASARAHTPPGTQEKVTKEDLAKCRIFFFFEAAFGPHIRQMRQGCASYSYTPRQSKKYGGCQTFGCARAHTPTQAHLSGTLPTRSNFFFFSEPPLRPASIKPGRMVHLYRAHTAHPKHLVFCKSLDANPVKKKKKTRNFGLFWLTVPRGTARPRVT